MRIEKMEDGVRAYVVHKCGHTVPLFFAAEEFARYWRPHYEDKVCVNCGPINAYWKKLK